MFSFNHFWVVFFTQMLFDTAWIVTIGTGHWQQKKAKYIWYVKWNHLRYMKQNQVIQFYSLRAFDDTSYIT